MARSFKNVIAGLSPREQRLVGVMGLLFIVFAIFLIVFLFNAKVAELEETSEELTNALRLLDEKADDYQMAQQLKQQLKRSASKKPTPLSTIVDKASKKVELDTPDTKELPDQPRGTQWVEHAVDLSLRDVGILKLTEFMEAIEDNRKKFPIAISKLEINKRNRAADHTYQVKMTVSTYEQVVDTTESQSSKSKKKSTRKAGRK